MYSDSLLGVLILIYSNLQILSCVVFFPPNFVVVVYYSRVCFHGVLCSSQVWIEHGFVLTAFSITVEFSICAC